MRQGTLSSGRDGDRLDAQADRHPPFRDAGANLGRSRTISDDLGPFRPLWPLSGLSSSWLSGSSRGTLPSACVTQERSQLKNKEL